MDPSIPFSFLYLVEIALAAVIVRARWTWTLVLVSLVGSGALFVGQRQMLVSRGDHMQLHLRGMWVAFGVAASFIVYFLLRVRRDLEAREAELVEAQRRVDRQERLASLATLAAGAAHELATPLATIALAARELERHLERAQADATSLEDVHLIRAQVDRCRAILDGMAADAGQSAGESAAEVGVAELLRAAAEGLRAAPPIAIEIGGVNGQRLRVPPRAVAQAIKSLLKNAQDASPHGAAVSLRAGVSGGSIAIEVIDRGEGMPAAVLARAGEPFFTTKEPGRGMGLGLFLTRAARRAAGRRAALLSSARTGAGTRALRQAARWHDRRRRGCGRRCFSSTTTTLSASGWRALFGDRGYDVRAAANYDEAIALARDDSPQFAVVDLKMPGRSGLEVVRDLQGDRSDDQDPGADRLRQHRHRRRSGAAGRDALPAQARRRRRDPGRAERGTTRRRPSATVQEFPAPSLARAEWEHIQRVLSDCGGNISEAARRLGHAPPIAAAQAAQESAKVGHLTKRLCDFN